jgi:mRNA-degrading endonuclease RelE of RelBE toxin-antitoxin system
MITVLETDEFAQKADALFSPKEKDDLVTYLSLYPESGDVIQGSGGLRKLRWQSKGRGKSGGARVIYFFYNDQVPLSLLTVYGKNKQEDLTAAQKKNYADFVRILKKEFKK